MSQLKKEPAWLSAKIDQRLAMMADVITSESGTTDAEMTELLKSQLTVMMTPLTEPAEGATIADMQRWERECDNCGAYSPPGTMFFTGHASRTKWETQIVFMFGMCGTCKELA